MDSCLRRNDKSRHSVLDTESSEIEFERGFASIKEEYK